jgi:Domain of unknown function (DUF4337)
MSEVGEIEVEVGEHHHGMDGFAKSVSAMIAVIGIILAIVTINAHRAHTGSVIVRTEANDQWAFYQAKKIREFTADAADGLAQSLTSDPKKIAAFSDKMQSTKTRYHTEAEDIQKEAKAKQHESDEMEHRALRFDLAEGLMQLGLVLTSLFFLGKNRFFPFAGGAVALFGLIVALTPALADAIAALLGAA